MSTNPGVEQHDPHVVVASTQDVLAACQGAPEHTLDRSQRVRWQRLVRRQDRDDFVAARLLAADMVRVATGVAGEVRFAQHCPVCDGAHGAPRVLSHAAGVSWAHSRGVVAAAAVRAGRVGIDVECLEPGAIVDPQRGVTGRHFVRGEALVKAGVLDLDAMLEAPLGWPFAPGRDVPVRGVVVRDLLVEHLGVIGAVAVNHDRPEATTC